MHEAASPSNDLNRPKALSLVIPVYFSAETLPDLFIELQAFEADVHARSMELELIFVDDGSGDSSFEELLNIKRQRPATKLVKLSRNFGAVAATKTGFRFVTGDCLAVVAADLQDPIAKIREMLDHWIAGNKYVICQRISRNDPLMSKFLSGIYYRLVRWLIAKDYPVGGFDLMLLDKSMLPLVRDSSKNINTHLYAFWLGFKPVVLEYHRPERKAGRSRWTFAKKLKLAIDTVTGFSVAPIRIVSAFGFCAALLSFAYGIYIVIASILGGFDVAGFATIVALISFFGGLTLVMLGILGEYLWRAFDNVTNRPESVIDETFL